MCFAFASCCAPLSVQRIWVSNAFFRNVNSNVNSLWVSSWQALASLKAHRPAQPRYWGTLQTVCPALTADVLLTGKALEDATKRTYKTGEVGQAYVVDLPDNSALAAQGVRRVIHVIPPNMHPDKPNFVPDKDMVDTLLRRCYTNMLAAFFGEPATGACEEGARGPRLQEAPRALGARDEGGGAWSNGGSQAEPAALGMYHPPAAFPAVPHHSWQDALLLQVKDLAKHKVCSLRCLVCVTKCRDGGACCSCGSRSTWSG